MHGRDIENLFETSFSEHPFPWSLPSFGHALQIDDITSENPLTSRQAEQVSLRQASGSG